MSRGVNIPDCDICKSRGLKIKAVYDAKLTADFGGSWAYVCQLCFDSNTVCGTKKLPLGTGRGQKLSEIEGMGE